MRKRRKRRACAWARALAAPLRAEPRLAGAALALVRLERRLGEHNAEVVPVARHLAVGRVVAQTNMIPVNARAVKVHPLELGPRHCVLW